jgi:hypothetical protein
MRTVSRYALHTIREHCTHGTNLFHTIVSNCHSTVYTHNPPPPAGGTKQLPPTLCPRYVYIIKDVVEMAPPVSSAMLLAAATHLRSRLHMYSVVQKCYPGPRKYAV